MSESRSQLIISYTQAARLIDLETGQAPARVIDCHDLQRRTGVAIEDDDLIRNGVWDRASDHDREECGPCEHYDYEAIEGSWHDASSAWLASRGAAHQSPAGPAIAAGPAGPWDHRNVNHRPSVPAT